MARRVRQVAFRTTFAIPANMVAVLLTWSTLALCAGWMAGSVGLGLGTLAVLRACQSLAMPLEDARIDRAVKSVGPCPFPRRIDRPLAAPSRNEDGGPWNSCLNSRRIFQ